MVWLRNSTPEREQMVNLDSTQYDPLSSVEFPEPIEGINTTLDMLRAEEEALSAVLEKAQTAIPLMLEKIRAKREELLPYQGAMALVAAEANATTDAELSAAEQVPRGQQSVSPG